MLLKCVNFLQSLRAEYMLLILINRQTFVFVFIHAIAQSNFQIKEISTRSGYSSNGTGNQGVCGLG